MINPNQVTMTNTIMTSHTVAITATANSTVTVRGMLWFGNETIIGGAGTYLITHIIVGNAAFTSSGYRLSTSSAAIDSGIPSGIFHDIDLEPAPSNSLILARTSFGQRVSSSRYTYRLFIWQKNNHQIISSLCKDTRILQRAPSSGQGGGRHRPAGPNRA